MRTALFKKPDPTKRDVLISFSGGSTSAYMTCRMIRELKKVFNLYVVFANTGQELEKTLDFVQSVENYLEIRIDWVEALIDPKKGKGTRHINVDYENASRNGEPFEAMIKKYGIPNQAYPHCTRELKEHPIRSWAKQHLASDYITCIGMRADETSRISKKCEKKRYCYPLIFWGVDREEVYDFWDEQPFKLEIESYQGNCAWCWKKHEPKHFRLIQETPEIYDFPRRMENLYGLAGHNVDGTKRVFFRKNVSTDRLFEMAAAVNTDSHARGIIERTSGCEDECQPFE